MKNLVKATAAVLALCFMFGGVSALAVNTDPTEMHEEEAFISEVSGHELAASGMCPPDISEDARLYNTKTPLSSQKLPENNTVFNNEGAKPMASWQSITPHLVKYLSPEEADGSYYLFENNDGGKLEWVDSDLEYGDTAYGTWLVPSVNSSDRGNIRKKGEHVFMDISALVSEKGREGEYVNALVEARVFMGYDGDPSLAIYDLYLGTNGINIDFTVPEKDMQVWICVLVYVDSKDMNVKLMVTPGLYETRWDSMKKSGAKTLTADKKVTVDLDSDSVTEIVTPNYYFTNAKLYKFETRANTLYTAKINGKKQGFNYIIMDEDMQIISHVFCGKTALYDGVYEDCSIPFWSPCGGTFYVVVGGFDMSDSGKLEFTMMTQDESIFHSKTINIDLNDLTNKSYTDLNGYYDFSYSERLGYGYLRLARGYEYNITGSNEDVILWADEWETINLDNCLLGGILLYNQISPVIFNVQGKVEIKGAASRALWNYGSSDISHQYGNTAYFRGDKLEIRGANGVYLENYTVHFDLDTLDIMANPRPGNYPLSIWCAGKHARMCDFGEKYSFDNSKQTITEVRIASKRSLGFDGAFYCYVISEYGELYWLEEPDLENASEHVIVLRDGSDPINNKPVLGDLNLSGALDSGDATLILRAVVGIGKALTKDQIAIADMNQNGIVDTADATLVLRAVVG